jgi:uncharacterized RDD family membrane protein YckC
MEGELQDRRFAPPQARVDDVEPATEGLQLATRGARLRAALIDVVLGVFLVWLVARLTSFDAFATGSASMWTPQLATPLLGIAIFLAVHGWLLVRRGQTVGKVVVKIRIVRPDGTLASPVRVLALRYGVGWLATLVPAAGQIWGLLDALMIFRADHRCLHDRIADTLVVKA